MYNDYIDTKKEVFQYFDPLTHEIKFDKKVRKPPAEYGLIYILKEHYAKDRTKIPEQIKEDLKKVAWKIGHWP